MLDKIPVLFGPTGSGKSRLAMIYAAQTSAMILNMDSMQIYQGMDIGTAKPTAEDFEKAKHALFNITTIDKPYSVYDYQRVARTLIEEHLGKTPLLLVGGTGLYLSSLYYDFEFREEAEAFTLDELAPIDWQNPHRVERYKKTGLVHPKSERRRSKLPLVIYHLEREREDLYQRINRRVDAMVEEGLIEEVRALIRQYPLTEDSPLLKAIGYKELIPFLKGEDTLEHCIETLKMNTRRYAKRQITWVKHQYPDVTSLDATRDTAELLETLLKGE